MISVAEELPGAQGVVMSDARGDRPKRVGVVVVVVFRLPWRR
ncbi:hypothetical protein SAMN06272781_8060 [Streptomyces sp. 1222.2]|uniref:Uncharacterized protein n=1 Tax=Streptomyces stelliscabiei TaxID=146820 RepID=A0A8I0P1A7_9ACTN|nr:hypothetical protein [Streptomyces stelliscabiei]SOD83186.1 hypothetical protein SAMN06272781_8060 [Streptomyces sp. 1222.2]